MIKRGKFRRSPRARGFRAASHCIAIAYLLISMRKHLPSNPSLAALPQAGVLIHGCR